MAYDKFAAVDSSTLLFPPTVRENLAPISPNYIINGALEINQRSFSSTTTSQAFTFDRWIADYSGGTTTYSSQTFTPGAAPVAGYEGTTYIRLASTSQTSGGYTALVQKIEDVRTTAGKTVTVSFWAKASTGTPNIGISLDQGFGTGGSSAVINAGAVKTLTSSWARYTWTIAMPSISGKTIGTSSVNQFYIFTSVGSSVSSLGYPAVGVQNVTVDLWGIQIEEGAVATKFRRNANSIQGELAACQRYYQRFSTAGALAPGNYYNTTQIMAYVSFQTKMRTAVSTTFDYSTLVARHFSGGTIGLTSPVIEANDNGVLLFATVASGTRTANDAMTLYIGSGGYLGFSAEL